MASDKSALVCAKSAADDDPSASDLYQIGTVATILQLIRLPDGTVKVLVEGLDRAKIKSVNYEQDYVTANVSVLSGEEPSAKETDALSSAVYLRSLITTFRLSKKIPPEVMSSISSIDEAGPAVDTIASHMSLQLEEKQNLLELAGLQARGLSILWRLSKSEIDLFAVEKRIRGRVKKQMEKSQREYYPQ